MSRARSVGTGLAALALLAAAVVGLPVVLYRFGGWPLPHHIAGWHQIGAALSRKNDGSLLLAVIRDCSWLAWLLFTCCVLAEAQAVVRGRVSPRLRLGGMQGLAGHLVALAALAFTAQSAVAQSAVAQSAVAQSATALSSSAAHLSARPTEARAAGSQAVAGQVVAGQVVAGQAAAGQSGLYLGSPPADSSPPELPELDSASATLTRVYTVRSGDCLWSIAQRYLGAGDRFPEIARLNLGHRMGDGLVFTNPALIEPGWQLFLPGAHGGDGHVSANATKRSHVTAAGLARSHHPGHATADPHYRRRHPAARTYAPSATVGNSAARNAAAANAAAAPSRTSSASAVARPATLSQSPAEDVPLTSDAAGYRTSAGADPATDALPEAAFFVAGVLAGAVLTNLTRLRRRQRQERRRGRRIALPADDGSRAVEQRFRAAAPAQAGPLSTLRDALATLEAGILADGQQLPEIVGLHVTPDVLEVLLAAPAADAPPAPYRISPGRQGMCWQLDLPATGYLPTDTAGSDAGRGGASPGCQLLPGLVTVGSTGPGYLLLDLESLQVTGCDGAPSVIDRVLVTAATELATGQWSGWYDLILVGCDELEGLGRAEHCGTLDEALTLLEGRCATVGPRAAAHAPADIRALRLAEPDNEDWGLAILVSRIMPTPDQLVRLLELAEDGPGGIAAFVAGDPEAPDGRMAPAVLQLAQDPQVTDGIIANVVPMQLTVWPRALSAADYAAIGSLFTVAADLDDVAVTDEPYPLYAAPPWLEAADLESWPAADGPGVTADGPGVAADGPGVTPFDPYATADRPLPTGDLSRPDTGDLLPLADRWRPSSTAAPATDLPAAADLPTALRSTREGQASPPYLPQQTDVPRQQTDVPPLQVRILGPFSVTGGAERLQPKQAELVLALALAAPTGLSNSALCSILGADPDHPKPGDAVRQIIVRTRRRLGLASDGQEYVIHAGNGRYLLHPAAWLDWTQFLELARSGRAEELRAAVSLIGGQPFTDSYFWWIDIPLIETVRAELVDAAEALAEIELADGSPRAAARAVRAGLLADSCAEQLWRMLMRAEHAAGNMAGVVEAWRHCLDAIEDIAPGGEPHPDTVALYRQLTLPSWQRVPAT